MGDDDRPPTERDDGDQRSGDGAPSLDEAPVDDEDAFWARYGQRPGEEPEDEVQSSEGGLSAEQTLQGQGDARGLQSLSRADLRDHYGPVRTFFKRREHLYRSFQRQLVQARKRSTYDQVLAKLVTQVLLIVGSAVALGALAGVGVVAAMETGSLPTVFQGAVAGRSPVTVGALVVGLSTGLGVATALGFWLWHRVVKLRSVIAQRRRNINYNLPYAITFMFALSRAGVSIDRIIARLANSKGVYGAVAEEFDRVVREVEMFGNNLYLGLENLRAHTPSEELKRIIDDMLVILETGGDLQGYLQDQIDEQLEAAVAEQESFIEQLELLSEIFVVGFVAAPLFILVTLIVLLFLGADTLTAIEVIVYVGIPLAIVGYVVLIDSISGPFKELPVSFDTDERDRSEGPNRTDDDVTDWQRDYQRSKRRAGVRARFRRQVVAVSDDPWRVLLFSAPIALAIPATLLVLNEFPFSLAAMRANPITVTTGAVVMPLFVGLVPVVVVHEYRSRQERALQQRFPDVLELLANSNRRGLSLTRSLDIVANSTSGRLATETQRLRNDIAWNADLPSAFEAFGTRLSSPTLTRTAALLAEGSRATGDLYTVLSVAARDINERAKLQRDRRRQLQSYLVIVVIGFLVYLLVVLLLATSFLDPIAAVSESVSDTDVTSGPVSVASVPVPELRMILFHSALIQGFGSGVLAGKLAENSLYSGLKYGLALTILAVVAFFLV